MKKVFLLILIGFFISVNANAKNSLHVVKPGDTLWALSKAHYKDPFLWGKIWMNNMYLNDPNLIFPGEVIEYTKYGITIYKKAKTAKIKKAVLANNSYEKYDIAVFYDGGKYYSDCGGGFCVWHKKDFPIGKLSFDNYNNVETSTGGIVYIKTKAPVSAKRLYIYRGIVNHQDCSICPGSSVSTFIPIGEIKITKRIKPLVYKGVIENATVEINSNDTVSAVYPFKKVRKNAKFVELGNIPVKLIGISDVDLTHHTGYYMFFNVPRANWQVARRKNGNGYHIVKLPKPFTKYIVGKKIFVDRVDKNLPENTNMAEGIVVSQYKGYISVFFDTYNSGLKEMFDETKEYVLR